MFLKRTVLIAEDEPAMRLAIQDALEPLENFEVVEAVDGCEALEFIDDHKPELVILDLLMPKMGGIDVLETLQGRGEAEPTYKIVVLSALVEPCLLERLHLLGAYRVLTKPFHVDELLRIVEEVSEGLDKSDG